MEESFAKYNKRLGSMTTKADLEARAGSAKPPARRFWRDPEDDKWKPTEHSGYTVITPPSEEECINSETYEKLGCVQQYLLDGLGADGIAPAPNETFHLTVADLVAGNACGTQVQGDNEMPFLLALSSVFCRYSFDGEIWLEVLGLSLFPAGFIIAVLGAVSEEQYEGLMRLRNALYEDKALQGYGVERKYAFTGHITLAYIEKDASDLDQGKLAETLLDANEKYFGKPLPFRVARAEVRKFDNLSCFYRTDGWPVFDFK